ncbi:hypothetical protein Nmel_007406 [Mimus melanotis]
MSDFCLAFTTAAPREKTSKKNSRFSVSS